jgi:methylmalonyl-CoA mutase N-terminal domain/subunit
MPSLVEAVRARGSLGEIVGLMREAFGEYREEAIY